MRQDLHYCRSGSGPVRHLRLHSYTHRSTHVRGYHSIHTGSKDVCALATQIFLPCGSSSSQKGFYINTANIVSHSLNFSCSGIMIKLNSDHFQFRERSPSHTFESKSSNFHFCQVLSRGFLSHVDSMISQIIQYNLNQKT